MSDIEIKKGKQPDKEGGKGVNASGTEVGGRAYSAPYYCWNCGAVNWVPLHWDYFTCWYCGSFNWT